MELDDVESILANADFFEICDPDQHRLLAFASERRRYHMGDVLYETGGPSDGAHILCRGTVAVADDPQRPEKVFRVSNPGSTIGELALVLDRPRRTTVTAAGEVETLFVPRSAFVKLMRQFPDMAERVAERIENELGSYLGALEQFRARKSA